MHQAHCPGRGMTGGRAGDQGEGHGPAEDERDGGAARQRVLVNAHEEDDRQHQRRDGRVRLARGHRGVGWLVANVGHPRPH